MEYNDTDIAVCGFALRFPEAENAGEYEKVIYSAKDCITRKQPDISDAAASDMVYAYGRMKGSTEFDSRFFGISDREAAMMDPQQRWLITLCSEAMENSGHRISDNNFIGLFAGASDFFSVWKKIFSAENTGEAERFMHMRYLDGMLTSWTSYLLDLTGPSVPVKEACASSLAAVHLAVNSLLNYECDIALAGGINISVSQECYIKAENTMSPTGVGRSFDKDADGLVPGNGGGILVLRRLEDSIRDRDTIHAVIRGTALNNDGRKKSGYSMPSAEGQSRAMRDALSYSGLSYDDITYLETHGTATKLGDIIEADSIKRVYASKKRRYALHLGAVKNNVGHLNYAAGAAGLIKTILVLENSSMPPMTNFESVNKELMFDESDIVIDKCSVPWNRLPEERHAAVSAFGVGGQNCHIVLSGYGGEKRTPDVEGKPFLMPFSAKSKESIAAYYGRLRDHLSEHTECGLTDISYTLRNGREEYPFRSYAVVSDRDTFLRWLRRRPIVRKAADDPGDNVILLFQGSSRVPWSEVSEIMGFNEVFRTALTECFDILHEIGGFCYKELTPESDISEEWEYMMIYCISYAQRQWLEYLGVRYSAVMGYSAGEYMAAEAAGVIDLREALFICFSRNKALAKIGEGGMIVAAADAETAASCCEGSVSVSGKNTPDRTVLSGLREDIEKTTEKLDAKGIDHFEMPVSRSGHCSLVEPVLPDMEKAFRKVNFRRPQCRYFSASKGREVSVELTEPRYWISQTRDPVLFSDAVHAAGRMKNAVVLDIGRKEQLSGMYRRNAAVDAQQQVIAVMPDRSESAAVNILEGMGAMWQHGFDIDMGKAEEKGRRIPLPSYAFEMKDYAVKDMSLPKPSEENPDKETRASYDMPAEEKAIAIISSVIGTALSEVDLERSIYDFGLDSMTALMACSKIQNAFGIKFTMRNFMVSSTLGEVIERITEIVNGGKNQK